MLMTYKSAYIWEDTLGRGGKIVKSSAMTGGNYFEAREALKSR